MSKYISLIALFVHFFAHSQENQLVKVMPINDVSNILTDKVKTQFGITYTIFRVYQYDDKSGKNLIVLTESFDGVNSTNDTLQHKSVWI